MARDDSVRLDVKGLRSFRNELRSFDRALPKELQKANKAFASALVPKVQQAYRRHYPRPNARQRRRRRSKGTAQAVRATATQTSAAIAIGGARYPHMPGQEFGSDRYPQFRPSTGGKGRFLYPTLRSERPGLEGAYGEVLDELASRAFPERR